MSKARLSFERRIALGIAERVRAARMSAALSQEQLGEKAGLHRTYIGAIERGEKNITVVTLARLAIALACKPSALIPEETDAD